MSPASSDEDEDDDRLQHPAANGETSPTGWSEDRKSSGGKHWTEQSWKSDSGFNSDNAVFVAGGENRDDACRPSTLPINRLSLEENVTGGSKESIRTEDGAREAQVRTKTDEVTTNGSEVTEDDRVAAQMKSDRFNPFNKVPFIEEEHFESPTISNTPRYNFQDAVMEGGAPNRLEPGKYGISV